MVVGIVTANHDDAGQSVSFAITAGDPDSLFAIDTAGQITINDTATFDYTGTYKITVQFTEVGVATSLYIGAGLGPGPRDGLMTGITRRTGYPLGIVRGVLEVSVVVVGWLLGGTVGIGTLVFAFGIGPLVHLALHHMSLPPVPPPAIAPRSAR